MRKVSRWWLIGGWFLAFASIASIDVYHFDNPEQEQQYRELTTQLRCPKCQNNSIADSNAVIAEDMRQKVYQLLMEGQSSEQVIDYMVMRYGNFVTYQPPVTAATIILWIGPLFFLLSGGSLVILSARRSQRRQNKSPPLESAAEKRLSKLLKNSNRDG